MRASAVVNCRRTVLFAAEDQSDVHWKRTSAGLTSYAEAMHGAKRDALLFAVGR